MNFVGGNQMTELYVGEGKGKTTASIGLAIRAAGHKIPVYFYQFLKNGSSGEIEILKSIPGIEVKYPPVFYGFAKNMTKAQKEEMKEHYTNMLESVRQVVRTHGEDSVVIVLDEVIHACNHQLLSETQLCELLEHCSPNIEMILTGRNPSQMLLNLADYVSEVKKVKHPFDDGVPARKGIEF